MRRQPRFVSPQPTHRAGSVARHHCDHRHHTTYYSCNPSSNNRGRPDKTRSHAKAAYIPEPAVLDAVSAFYADRVFGPDRRDLLEADLATVDDRETRQREAERERLQRTLADLARHQDNVMRQAQDSDPNDPFTRGLRETYNDLETQRRATHAALADLDKTDQTAPARPTTDDARLLDALPRLQMNLTKAPEQLLRALFEITRLTIQLHPDSDDATITIRLPADDLPVIAQAAERITMTNAQVAPGHRPGATCADADRAPGVQRRSLLRPTAEAGNDAPGASNT